MLFKRKLRLEQNNGHSFRFQMTFTGVKCNETIFFCLVNNENPTFVVSDEFGALFPAGRQPRRAISRELIFLPRSPRVDTGHEDWVMKTGS